MKKDEIITILRKHNYSIESDMRAPNNYGDVLRLSNGSVINCYDTGKACHPREENAHNMSQSS